MKIQLSNQDMLRNFNNFLESVDLSNPNILEVYTHKKMIAAHPAFLVFIAAIASLDTVSHASFVNDLPPGARSLERMNVFDYVTPNKSFQSSESEPTGKFIPITKINNQADQSRFISEIVPLLHLPEEKATIIKYVIGELIKNTLEHSRSSSGALVAAQYYPKSKRIGIGICDTGIGIWHSINSNWNPRTDLDAIKLALSPGISGTTSREGGTSENAGAGLFFIKSIAKITRSHFVIYSGKGYYALKKADYRLKSAPRLYADPNKDSHIEDLNAPDFGGTLVAVDINLTKSPAFDALLSQIGDVYSEAIRERKKLKYREPKFI